MLIRLLGVCFFRIFTSFFLSFVCNVRKNVYICKLKEIDFFVLQNELTCGRLGSEVLQGSNLNNINYNL